MIRKRLTAMSGRFAAVSAIALGAAFAAPNAHASLSLFQQYTGKYGLSTDGFGSVNQDGTINAYIPVGATVTAAYLYTSTFGANGAPAGNTLGGQAVSYTAALGTSGFEAGNLEAYRANVTDIVKAAAGSGSTIPIPLSISESQSNQDGEALVVVYSLPSLATTTIGLLDGFSNPNGDSSKISFASPLDPSSPGFQAEMRIGDGFSCCGQESTITINGKTLTTAAGNNDDSVDGNAANGNLITVGGNNDPFTVASPNNPATDYNTDHERYDLTPFISKGDTVININTFNQSDNDNIFLEDFVVSGEGRVISNGVPEPSTWAMMIIGFAGIGFMSTKRARASRRNGAQRLGSASVA